MPHLPRSLAEDASQQCLFWHLADHNIRDCDIRWLAWQCWSQHVSTSARQHVSTSAGLARKSDRIVFRVFLERLCDVPVIIDLPPPNDRLIWCVVTRAQAAAYDIDIPSRVGAGLCPRFSWRVSFFAARRFAFQEAQPRYCIQAPLVEFLNLLCVSSLTHKHINPPKLQYYFPLLMSLAGHPLCSLHNTKR
jgi:hypothetical protein